MMNQSIDFLYSKLDEFIKKYYRNEVIKGIFLSILICVLYVVTISLSEYFIWFSQSVRTFIFYFSIIIFLIVAIKYIVIPILHFFKIGKVIDRRAASKIISKHFPEFQDKLYNTLELADNLSDKDNDLILASIQQRIEAFKPFSFNLAINFTQTKKYLKIMASILIVVVFAVIFYPRIFTEPTNRIINHSVYYEKQPPFTFKLMNESLKIKKGSDCEIELFIDGDYVPKYAELVIGSSSYMMRKKNAHTFIYLLKNLNNEFQFHFSADAYNSEKYNIEIINIPQLLSFTIDAEVPDYTSIDDFNIENIGDITVPCGTKLLWNIKCVYTDSLFILIDSTYNNLNITADGNYIFTKNAMKTFQYKLLPINSEMKNESVTNYTVTVLPDIYPQIAVETKVDSANMFMYYVKGLISDDYGFSKLNYVYYPSGNESEKKYFPIEFNRNMTNQEFYYMIDFSSFSMGDKIEYYFEIWDNDIIGAKSSRSNLYDFALPDAEELRNLADKSFESLNNKADKSISLADELQNDLKKMQRKFLDEKTSSFEKNQMIESLQEKHDELKDLLKSLADEQSSKNEMFDKLTEQKSEILEKQKQLQELLDKLMDPELEALFEEFNKLKDEFDKDKFFELSEKMEMSYDDLEKQIDKNIELFKRFEVEQKIENTISDLEKLAKEQHDLKDKIGNIPDSELKEKQNKIDEELNNIEKNFKDAIEKNEALEEKMNLESFDEEFKNLENSQNEISNSLDNNKKKQAKESMQKSSNQMNEMAQKMQKMMQENQSQQAMENMDNLRQIMDNLMTFSFEQEELLENTKNIDRRNPQYSELSASQNKLKENFDVVKDSLYALARRTLQINSTISNELLSIQQDMLQSITFLEQTYSSQARVKQQYVMTSVNNLALLLDEVLQQMQQSAAQQMSGQQQCQNPNGQGNGQSFSQLKQQQQSVKSQLQQMIDQMKQNGQEGSKQSLNKQLSKMLSQQEQHRQMLEDLMQQSTLSPEAAKKLHEIDKMMQQTEKDIINKNISQQTMMRQNQIMSRLLEAENSEREREYDKKRESNEAKELFLNQNLQLKKDETIKQFEKENLEYSNIKMNNFYRKKYNEYLINIESK